MSYGHIQRMGNLYADTLKRVGIFSLLIYPICHGIINRFVDYDITDESVYEDFDILTVIVFIADLIYRLSFPIFAFVFLELIHHTHNRMKHALFLFLSSVISEIPYNFIIKEEYFEKRVNNILFDFFLSYMILWVYSIFSEKYRLFSNVSFFPLFLKNLIASIGFSFSISFAFGNLIPCYVVFLIAFLLIFYASQRYNSGKEISLDLIVFSVFVCIAKILRTQYGCFGIAAVSCMYLLRKNRVRSMIFLCLVLTVGKRFDLVTFLVVLMINNYGGWRGTKYAFWFYVLYPIYLLIIFSILTFIEIGEPFSFDDMMKSFNQLMDK